LGEKVSILLCCADGELFLGEQLESIALQTNSEWRLVASDDSRKNATDQILKAFSEKHDGKVEIRKGPRRGFVANFLSLACDQSIGSDYFAYCDQDDIWESDKIARALHCLAMVPRQLPALYCSRTRLIDDQGNVIGHSRVNRKPPGFSNALVQNLASGNTMVFNNAARKLLVLAGPDAEVPFHDWWLYILVSGAGGRIFYDAYPTVRYRQHDNNLFGSHSGLKARTRRLRLLFQSKLKNWSDRNLSALHEVASVLTEENRLVLEHFASAREGPLIRRVIQLKASKVYRQTRLESAALIVAAVMNKI
jgi:glycosyltransferase involved in cell wall biosynthesis